MTEEEIEDIINWKDEKKTILRDLRGIEEIREVAKILFEKFHQTQKKD